MMLPQVDTLRPLWEATAPARQASDRWRNDPTGTPCDVAVIGAGFTGLSAAIALAESGARVVLLEAGLVGGRASGRNAGQVVPGLKPRADTVVRRFGAERGQRMLDFAHTAAERAFTLIEKTGIDCNLTRKGWIQGAFSRRSRDALKERAEINALHGANVEFLDEARVAALTGSHFHHGGMIERGAGAVQPLKLARGLADYAQRIGVVLHEHSRVLALDPPRTVPRAASVAASSGGWTLRLEAGRLQADQVILATDGYTDGLWPAMTQALVKVTSAQLATDPLPARLRDSILPARAGVSETRKITYYYRIDPEGRFVIGGRGPLDDGLDRATVARIARAATERFPGLRDCGWTYGWSCRVAMTMDDLPHVHQLAPGLWTAFGYCGRGVALALGLGPVLAQLARHAHPDDIDYPVTQLRRVPLYPLRQPAAAAAIVYYRIKDRLGAPS